MRDAHDHDPSSAETGGVPPGKRPVWPEDIESTESAPELSEIPDDGFLTLAEVERHRDAIAAELSHREMEMERRARAVAKDNADLERKQRDLRAAETRLEEQSRTDASKANAIRAELGDRLKRCEELIADLEREQAVLDSARRDLNSDRETIQEAVLEDLADERRTLEADREAFTAEKTQFRARLEERERELDTRRQELRSDWESERETLRVHLTDKLAAELDERQRKLDAERAEWERQRQQEQQALDEQRAKHEELLGRAETNLGGLREELEQEFQQRRRDLEAEIAGQVESLEARLAEEQSGWESTRSNTEAELQSLREELESRRDEQDRELETARQDFQSFREEQLRRIDEEAHARVSAFEQERAAWIAERDAARKRIDEENAALDELQRGFEQECEQRRSDLEQELAEQKRSVEEECESTRRALEEDRAVAENRLHFQSDHLDRTREGLEEARREVDLRIQHAQTRSARMAEIARGRKRQLDRYRDLLDQKEQSLQRERDLLKEIRRHSEAEESQTTFRPESRSLTTEMRDDSEKFAEQTLREELSARSKHLAERQSRLETLRVEIDSTHRENLELRAALDDAWSRLSQSVGPETARLELRVSRDRLAEHFRGTEKELDRRRELLTREAEAARRQAELLDSRRADLTEWLNSSLATLRRRANELNRWTTHLETRDERMRGLTRRWHDEKLEAEQIIRELLDQLARATDRPRHRRNSAPHARS